MSLTQEEIKIIALIDERLKYYNFIQADSEKEPILQGFATKIEEQSKEVRAKMFVQASINIEPYLTKGKWYEIIEDYAMCWQIVTDMGAVRSVNKVNFHPPVSEQEYTAQQEPKEWKCVNAQFSECLKCETQCNNCKNFFAGKQIDTQINESKGERYGVNVGANHSKFEVRVFGIESEEKANQISTAIRELLKTL